MPQYVSHLEGAIDGARLPFGQLHGLHNGRPIWVREQPHFHPFTSLAASQEQLVLCQGEGTLPTTPPTLWGLDLETGKLEWSTQVAKAGQIAIGHGLLFLNTGESITAYAPAERTFRWTIHFPVSHRARSGIGPLAGGRYRFSVRIPSASGEATVQTGAFTVE